MDNQAHFRFYQKLKLRIVHRQLIFKRPAKTSRDTLHNRDVWYMVLTDNEGRQGIGECAPIFGLSPESKASIEQACEQLKAGIDENTYERIMLQCPAVRSAMESAVSDYENGGIRKPFSLNDSIRIPINGLVWMNDKSTMMDEAFRKIDEGYQCIKLKVGSLKFEDELDILRQIRSKHSNKEITLRLDANGAFETSEALRKLEALALFKIHSIEQPIRAGQPEALKTLVQLSPIPIALDEELIGKATMETKKELLDEVMPQYIVLKPTLHDGFDGCDEWIALAEERSIQWWATSALESSIGLNAIARWLTTKATDLPQGLGTGSLFENNIASPLQSGRGYLWYDHQAEWQLNSLQQ